MKNNTIFNIPNERAVITHPFVWWDNGFTEREVDQIVSYCDSKGLESSTVLGGERTKEEVRNIRRCGIKFHGYNDNTKWIFEKLNNIIWALNSQFYGFDLNGYDHFQYTVYNAEELGHYDWHMDMVVGPEIPSSMIEPRKLSITFSLNDGFEGGELQVASGDQNIPAVVETKKGRIIAFPSFMHHRVTPVTKGIRKSLVVWVVGPKFT